MRLVAALMLVVGSGRAVADGAAPGHLVSGPYLFCGDEEGMFHLLHEDRALIHGIGVYSGINGYTRPDGMSKKDYARLPDVVRYAGEIPGSGISIEQTASLAGRRITLTIRRSGRWPQDTWGNVHLPLPLIRYLGAAIRADGRRTVLPAAPGGPLPFPGTVKRLELLTGSPYLDLTFECADGLGFDDHRRFNAPSYIVSVPIPRGDRDTVSLTITLPDLPPAPPRLRWSRIGYPQGADKAAVVEWPRNAARPRSSATIERRDGTVAWRGAFGPTATSDDFQNHAATLDFAALREAGEYRIVWAGGATDWFPVQPSVFTDRLWEPTLDYSIPFMMCHAAVELGKAATGHGLCHTDDAARAPAHHTGPDGFISYEAEGTPFTSGEHLDLSTGGWHDAGDYDLNVPAQSFVVWTLALAWEEFRPARDSASLDTASKSFRAAAPDGAPDLIQQVEWGARWLLSVQQPDGRTYNGVCDQPAQRSGKPVDVITDRVNGTPDDRFAYVDYHADSQLNHVIAMAAAARALREHRPALAARCRDAAILGFAYFLNAKEVYRPGSYTATEIKGKERDGSAIAAAIELYLTTNDVRYLGTVEDLSRSLPDLTLDWPLPRLTGTGGFRYAPPFLARLIPKLKPGKLRDVLLATCRRAGVELASRMAQRPWPLRTWEFGQWGNNGTALGRVFDTYWLTKVVPDALPPEAPLRNMLWLYGLHPASDTVMIAGLGYPAPEYLYSCHLHAVNGFAPGTIPGAVVPGMGGFWYSGVVTHIDEYGYYGHNEACIYTQASYLFAVHAMRKMGF